MLFALMMGGMSVVSTPAQAAGALPDTSQRLITMAEMALDGEDTLGAIRLYHQAMIADPMNIAAYTGLGKVYVSQGQYKAGIRYYDIALSIDQVDLSALEGKAMAHLKAHNLDGARESFRLIQQVCAVSACEEMLRVATAIDDFENSDNKDDE